MKTDDEASGWNAVGWPAHGRRLHQAAARFGRRARRPDRRRRSAAAPLAAAAEAAAAAPATVAAVARGACRPAVAGAPIGSTGFKECAADGLIDDGEDGNNQNMPNDNRGGYWYTFRDKKGTTIEPVAGEDGGTFAMSEGGHGSQFAARYHGKIGTGAPLFGGHGHELRRSEGGLRRFEVRRHLVLGARRPRTRRARCGSRCRT